MKRFTLFISLCLFGAMTLWAQSTSTTLPEVVVTATRIATPSLDAPAFTTVITAQQIAHSPAADLASLLGSQAGLLVSSDGPRGAVSTVSMRGSTSSEVLVLLDGVPLNSSRDGSVDLSHIPLDMIDHIEIVRGGESSIYGSNAIGGVINIITKKASKKTQGSLQVENGSYLPHKAMLVSEGMVQTPVAANPLDLVDTQTVSASAGGHIGSVGLTAAGGFTRAANGFVWKDSTYINNWRRENHAGGFSGNGYAKLQAPFAHGTLSASSSVVASSYDVPGTLSGFGLTTHASQQRTTAGGTVGYNLDKPPGSRLGLNSRIYYQYDRLHYADPSTFPATDSLHVTNTVGGEVTSNYRFSDLGSVIYGASARYDGLDSTDLGIRSRLNLGGFLSAELNPLPTLSLTPSVRYDYFTDVSGGLSYRLGAVLSLNDFSSLKGSVSDSYRVPAMNDLYWPSSPYAYGNPALKPERAVAADFGYSARSRSLSLDAAVFTRLIKDQIVWAPTGNPITSPWTPQNLGRSLLPGVDIGGRIDLTKHLSLTADYSFIYSFVLNGGGTTYTVADNKRVPYVPLNTLTGGLSYSRKGSRVSIDGNYVSKEYTDSANTAANALASHVVFNLSYLQSLGKNLSLSLVAKNLLDSVYETQAGYPMTPFSLWAGVDLKL